METQPHITTDQPAAAAAAVNQETLQWRFRKDESTLFNTISIFRKSWWIFLLVQAVATITVYLASTFTLMWIFQGNEEAQWYTDDNVLYAGDGDDDQNNAAAYNYDDFYYNAAYDDRTSNTSYENGSDMLNAKYNAVLAVETIIFYIIQCFADGVIIRATAETAGGVSPTLVGCLKTTCSKLVALMLANLVVSCLIMAPLFLVMILIFAVGMMSLTAVTLLCLLWLVYAYFIIVVTYHMYTSIVVEGKGPISSIKRSIDLSSGHRCYILTVIILFGLAKSLVNTIVTSLSQSNNELYNSSDDNGVSVDFNMGNAGDGVISVLFAIIFTMFGSILQAVVYLTVRSQEEPLYTNEALLGELGIEDAQTNYVKMRDAIEMKGSHKELEVHSGSMT